MERDACVPGMEHDSGSLETSSASSSSDEEDTRASQPSISYDSPDIAREFFYAVPQAAQVRSSLLQQRKTALEALVLSAAHSTSCPQCGVQAAPSGLSSVEVTVVTWEQPIRVSVPRMYCGQCKAEYSIRPTTLDCTPDYITSWDVLRARDKVTVLWWQSTLIQHFILLQFFNRHLSMDRFCATMLENWAENGIADHGLSLAQLRQRLRRPVRLRSAQRQRALRRWWTGWTT